MTEEKAFFNYGQDSLDLKKAMAITEGDLCGQLDSSAVKAVEASVAAVNNIVAGNRTVYGINTGFGPLCTTRISAEDTKKLQYNILRSHSSGLGETIDRSISKLMMIIKVNSLGKGNSGIRRKTLERIIWHIDHDFISLVPCQGSVGASGDLAPLSHLFLPLIGLGEVDTPEGRMPAAELLKKYKKEPLELGPKEGLALINGTQFMAAHGLFGLKRLENCLDHADLISAMTIEALLGSDRPFMRELHELRPYEGCVQVAKRMRALLRNSEIIASHRHCDRVQDPYSLRCIPQVHGASRNSWNHLKKILEIEINAVTDNPVITADGDAVSGGNFHGQPIALPLDYACLAASEMGNISDRRSYLLLMGGYRELPKLLIRESGLNSGFMIPQYLSAALVTENKTMCFPASADSIPTSLGQEDHVSMGSVSARKLLKVIDNLEKILAVEMVLAAQGIDFRRPLASSAIIDACHSRIRESIDHADEDRIFAYDLEKARQLVASGELMQLAEATAEATGISLK